MIAIQTMKVFSSAKYPKCPGGGPLIFLLAATLLSPLSSHKVRRVSLEGKCGNLLSLKVSFEVMTRFGEVVKPDT